MSNLLRTGTRPHLFLASSRAFYLMLALFGIGVVWIALFSLYPMAFDEEFHYGLIKIYATSLLPYGIQHTSDMAQFGSATADASYLFHYLMSFPYRLLNAIGLPDMAIIITLRFMNIAFVAGGLVLFKKALQEAKVSPIITNLSLLLVTLIPIFPLLAAHINYDNLLLLVFAWCVLCLVRITNVVRSGKPFPLGQSVQLIAAVLIGMSVKYAFLPLALAMFIWVLWLLVLGYKLHKKTISTQLAAWNKRWKSQGKNKRLVMIGLVAISLFFVSHYATNMVTYGSPIPSCERVFSEKECTAYGPWNRNKNMEARKSPAFVPVSYPEYMVTQWLPGMAQRLTFAVAGKTNGFQTKMPFVALMTAFVSLTVVGVVCFVIQAVRRRGSWLWALTALITVVYCGVLSFQLYGDYIDTSYPVAINGRYLIPILPLVTAVLIQSIVGVFSFVDRRILAIVSVVAIILLFVAGAGVSTYIVLAESHWFWPGFGQSSHELLQSVLEPITLPWQY